MTRLCPQQTRQHGPNDMQAVVRVSAVTACRIALTRRSWEGTGICYVQVGNIPALPLTISHGVLGGGALTTGPHLVHAQVSLSVRLISYKHMNSNSL